MYQLELVLQWIYVRESIAQLSIKGDFEFLIKTNFRRSAIVEGNISIPATTGTKNFSRYK